jgi:ParB family transcriptional regulator, chromosome partitioning protein
MNQPNIVYANVPLAKLMESPLNFRRHFDEGKLAQLAANIKTIGVRSPLLVRPIKDGKPWLDAGADLLAADAFEIGSGHRRYRASKTAGLESVPAVIQAMTDDAFIETLSVEILQHEDVHPLDEAGAYQDLLKRPGYDAHVIAARTGKDALYVQRRLSLLRLITDVRKAFMDGPLNLAMAQIVARLTPDDQKEALRRLMVVEKDDWDAIRSSRELQKWVSEELMMSLAKAPFDPSDPDLIPAAGTCEQCPKRTGFMPELFPGIEATDTCTDRKCFEAKKSAGLLVKIREIQKKGGAEPLLLSTSYEYKAAPYEGRPVIGSGKYTEVKKGKKPECEFQKDAIVVRGRDGIGKTIEVCVNPRCPVHAGRNAAAASLSKEERAAREKREFDQAVDDAVRLALIQRLMAQFYPGLLKEADYRLLAKLMFQKCGNSDSRRAMSKARTGTEEGHFNGGSLMAAWIREASEESLFGLIFESALYEGLDFYGADDDADEPDELLWAARRWGISVDLVRAEIEADLYAKKKAAAENTAKAVAKKGRKNA